MFLCSLLCRHLLTRTLSFLVFLQRHLILPFLPHMEPSKPNLTNPNPSDTFPGAEVVMVGEEESAAAAIAAAPPERPEMTAASLPSRTPFTNLSQVDADLALARTLQEQERAYMMLRMGGVDDGLFAESDTGSDFELHYEESDVDDFHLGETGSVDGSDYDEEEEEDDQDDEDAFDAHEHGLRINPSAHNDDEAYARALQEVEERQVAARLMALTGISEWTIDDREDDGINMQDSLQDIGPDELSYEELIALGEVVGTENRGLSVDIISSLPSVSYEARNTEDDEINQCVICRLDFEDGDSLIILSCKHAYHSECINKWLQINKVCPVCSREVSASASRQG